MKFTTSSKRFDITKTVKVLSWMFFAPFVPYIVLAIWTNGTTGSAIFLLLWPIFYYLLVVGVLYLVALIEYIFSSSSNNTQKILSTVVVLVLVALAIWLFAPLILDY